MKKSIILILCLVIHTSAFSQLEGHWYGTTEKKGKIVFHITKEKDRYTATYDCPDIYAYGYSVEEVLIDGSEVIIKIPSIGAVFYGQINSDNNEINGTFEQGGLSMPLNLLTRPQTPKETYPYYSHDVIIENLKDSIHLAGTLTLPDSVGKYPVAILISGSGPHERDATHFGHKTFLVIADYLTKNGIGVLRFDDRGVGNSTGNFYAATLADFAHDVESCFHYLQSHKNVLPDKIGLIGHSEGGSVAAMVAGNNKNITFVVFMASPAVSGDKIVYAQTMQLYQNLDSIGRLEQVNLRRQLINILRYLDQDMAEGALWDILVKNRKLLSVQNQDTIYTINSIAAYLNSDYYRSFISYDPAMDFKKIACPVLGLYAEKDTQVLPSQNIPAFENAFAEAGKYNSAVEFPDVNHEFQTVKNGTADENSELDETISPEVLLFITYWIIDNGLSERK